MRIKCGEVYIGKQLFPWHWPVAASSWEYFAVRTSILPDDVTILLTLFLVLFPSTVTDYSHQQYTRE